MQLEDYHSLERLGHEHVLVGVVVAELDQLTWARLVQLKLGVGLPSLLGIDQYGSSRYRYRYMFLADISADTDIFG